MEIDIISYTDEQFALLSEEQILEIKAAQLKKNKLDRALEEDLAAEKRRLVERGIFLSRIWELYCEKRTAERDAEVEAIRDALLFYLRFVVRAEDADPPYPDDYSLSMEERLAVVREYYEGDAFTDGASRFEAFAADNVAKKFLGELYAPLYDYYLSLV